MFRISCIILMACVGITFTGTDIHAKKYKLNKSDKTGWWGWECKDGSSSGWSSTKSGARDAAKDACGSIANSDFNDPLSDAYGAMYDANDHYTGVLVQTLDNVDREYAPHDFPENVAFYVYEGYSQDPSLTEEAIVIGQLRAWGIYLGGETRAQIENIHNLEAHQFDRIVQQDVEDGWVTSNRATTTSGNSKPQAVRSTPILKAAKSVKQERGRFSESKSGPVIFRRRSSSGARMPLQIQISSSACIRATISALTSIRSKCTGGLGCGAVVSLNVVSTQ